MLSYLQKRLTGHYAYGNLKSTMVHHKNHSNKTAKLTPLVAASVVVVSAILAPVVRADQFDEQIKQRQAEQQAARDQANMLGAQASDVQSQINDLQSQIASVQAQIDTNTAKQSELTTQIEAAQKKLEEQKGLLSANIRSMYIEGDISPLEMIASSKNLGDFVDKQEYRDRIKENISSTMDEIERLKKQLDEQRKEVTRILDEQKTLRGTLDQKNAEAGSKLASINQDKAGFDATVRQKSAEIASLRAQQLAANARFFGPAGTGPACGGGYPGQWCNIPMDTVVDSWGMYNRECVSYTAFKVAQSGRYMPHGRGQGNANEWPGNATGPDGRTGIWSRYGVTWDYSPREGDVAISMAGYYGHAMYVEAVVNSSTIIISDYNSRMDGRYGAPRTVSSSGLRFVHFP